MKNPDQLGGQLLAAAKPAYKAQEIQGVIDYYSVMLNKLGVKVKLNSQIKDSLPDDLEADVVVLATGALPQIPKFKGSENMVTAWDVLMSDAKGVGQEVVVIGASGVGIDVALFLKEKAERKVTVIEKLDEIGGDVNDLIKPNLLKWANEKEIQFLSNCEAFQC